MKKPTPAMTDEEFEIMVRTMRTSWLVQGLSPRDLFSPRRRCAIGAELDRRIPVPAIDQFAAELRKI